VDFTPEFEQQLRDIFNEILKINSVAAGEFVTGIQEARELLAREPGLGFFYCYTTDGEPLYAYEVPPGWRLIFLSGEFPALVWIEPV
jgi:hypothetical protein